MTETLQGIGHLRGTVRPPADKSIAHRAALFAALGSGTSEIVGYPNSADPQSTLACLRGLGIQIETQNGSTFVHGRGLDGLAASPVGLDCGNSGTTMRLLAGILAGQGFDSVLVGDASLSKRPMRRIAVPLELMGAEIRLEDGHAPMYVHGRRPLRAVRYELPVASAQVKSCVLLAGFFGEGETEVVEQRPSRDHTERMLGLAVREESGVRVISVSGGAQIPPRTWVVPGDFSAAAFFLVAATLVPDSHVGIENVCLNPTRTGLLGVLREMGARIEITRERESAGETVGDLVAASSGLRATSIGGAILPSLIDEVPILAVAATQAEGRTTIRDAGELRVKESDRITSMATNLRALGADVRELEDGMIIEGPTPLRGGAVESFDDHRVAMAMGIAGALAEGITTISGAECASVSYPGFWEELRSLSA